MTFAQKASAEFEIGCGPETIKVDGVPYTWCPEKGDRDSQAAYAVALYIGENNLTKGKPITLMWVTSEPNKG